MNICNRTLIEKQSKQSVNLEMWNTYNLFPRAEAVI